MYRLSYTCYNYTHRELYEYLPENTISMKYDDNDVIEEGVELFKTG